MTHQFWHGSPPLELSPGKHALQLVLPAVVDSRPAGHNSHISPPELTPIPSHPFSMRVTYELAGHSSHSAAPSAPLNVPLGHGRHSETPTAPGSARNVPMGHGEQSPIAHE